MLRVDIMSGAISWNTVELEAAPRCLENPNGNVKGLPQAKRSRGDLPINSSQLLEFMSTSMLNIYFFGRWAGKGSRENGKLELAGLFTPSVQCSGSHTSYNNIKIIPASA